MGGLNSLVKHVTHGISSAVKGIVGGVTKAFKAVGNAVKSFLQSDIGKIVVIGAAIWLGGAALGYWSSGFSTIDGALVATQAGGAAATEAGATAASTGAGTAATDAAASAATGGLSDAAATAPAAVAPGVGAGSAGIGAGAPVTAAGAPAYDYPFLHDALTGGGQAGGGIMFGAGSAITGAAKWMAANPIPTLLAGNMLSSALSPNQMDVNNQQNQFRIDEENRQQQKIDEANARLAQVGSIPTMRYSGAPLPTPTPPVPAQPAGIMGRKLII